MACTAGVLHRVCLLMCWCCVVLTLLCYVVSGEWPAFWLCSLNISIGACMICHIGSYVKVLKSNDLSHWQFCHGMTSSALTLNQPTMMGHVYNTREMNMACNFPFARRCWQEAAVCFSEWKLRKWPRCHHSEFWLVSSTILDTSIVENSGTMATSLLKEELWSVLCDLDIQAKCTACTTRLS